MKRYITNTIAALIIVAVGFVASSAYETGDTVVNGATADVKLQAIANIVTKQQAGAVSVIYLKPKGSDTTVGFIFGVTKSEAEITSQEEAMARQKALQKAEVTTLRLVATKVLPTEPEIQYVSVLIILDGGLQTYVASAEELKALPADAADMSWLSKLKEP